MTKRGHWPEMDGRRLVFLDAARCIAIVLMVFAHVSDALRFPEAWSGAFGVYYGYLRGLTAPIFFTVSGWAFSLATVPKAKEFQRFGPQLWRRLRRVGTLLLWGYALTLPWWAEGFPFRAAPEVWGPFFAIGVLQCVAVALLVAQGLLWLSSSARRYAALAFGVGLATVFLGASVGAWSEGLWAPLRGFFFAGEAFGGFPVAPNAAFFWLGSAAGAFSLASKWSERRLGLWLVPFGLLAMAIGPKLGVSSPESAALFIYRLGAAAVLLGAVALLTAGARVMPSALRRVSQRPLTFYVGHMVIIWGVPFVPGLAHRVGPLLGPGGCALWTAASLLAIYAVLVAYGALKARFGGLGARRASGSPASSPEAGSA